jgi:hypothetical protein
VIEGAISIIVGVASFFLISDSPAKASTRLFSDEEKRFVILRARFTYGSSQSGSKDDFIWKDFASCLKVCLTKFKPDDTVLARMDHWLFRLCFLRRHLWLYLDASDHY